MKLRRFLQVLRGEVELKGHPPGGVASGWVEQLSDDELRRLNALLPWKCFTVDRLGRRFGRPAGRDKRHTPQRIPDYRSELLDAEFSLRGKRVLEVGCFEGVHTTSLALLGASVTAIDSRLENVVKTMVRTGFYGMSATVHRCNVEIAEDFARLPKVDIVHHVGVLYHLKDPVSHLLSACSLAKRALLLDTHVARAADADHSYQVAGRSIPYKHFREGAHSNPFAGMYDHAKWLTLETLRLLFEEGGMHRIRVVEEREERNGPRVLLLASRA